ncbi:MAG: endonuclease/exonuclease/phosphatase family protein [Planctomycetes bacterium]|nr:endonuclease/exonuclease/phosphatase family protein [Planctomycetota bacterium]
MSTAHRKKFPARSALVGSLTLATSVASIVVFSARWHWIGELVASFAWHVGCATLGVAVAVAALGSRRLALALAALGLVHVAPEASLWLAPRVTHGSEASLSIVSANLLQPNRHADEVAAALSATDADVIAVLELSSSMRATLDRALSGWPHRSYSPQGPWHSSIWALGVYSRVPLRDVQLVHLRECYAPAIEARVALGSELMTLRIVHLPRPGQAWRVAARNEALEQVATRFEWSPTAVLLGDLNTVSSSPAFADLLEHTALRDSRRGFGRQPSWWLRSLGVPLAIAIDHVLVGSRLEVLERETFEIPFSDHAGVRTRLALRASAAKAP